MVLLMAGAIPRVQVLHRAGSFSNRVGRNGRTPERLGPDSDPPGTWSAFGLRVSRSAAVDDDYVRHSTTDASLTEAFGSARTFGVGCAISQAARRTECPLIAGVLAGGPPEMRS